MAIPYGYTLATVYYLSYTLAIPSLGYTANPNPVSSHSTTRPIPSQLAGFFYARSTRGVVGLFDRALAMMDEGQAPLDGTDQGALNLALLETPSADLPWATLDCDEVAHGGVHVVAYS
jgi:hypothetical protein